MMQSRSNSKVLVFIIFLLLVTNIAVLGYFLFLGKKKPPKNNNNKDGFAAVLRKEVGFNEEQVTKFNELKKSHWAEAKTKMEEITNVKNTIFDLTKTQDTVSPLVETLADSIGRLQKQVEINSFKHIVATRKICTADQQSAYDSLMKKIINRGKVRKPADATPPPQK